jgi:hypothetical protein
VEGIPIYGKVVQTDPSIGDAFINMNQVFEYASNYMHSLKHMHVFFNEQTVNALGLVKMSPTSLKKFLETRPLCGFGLLFCRRYPNVSCVLTDGGRALLPLSTHQHSLKQLDLSNNHFDRVSDFAKILSGCYHGQSLRHLELANLSFGTENAVFGALSIWSLQDAKGIAQAIKNLASLEHLMFGQMEDECLKRPRRGCPCQIAVQQTTSTSFWNFRCTKLGISDVWSISGRTYDGPEHCSYCRQGRENVARTGV